MFADVICTWPLLPSLSLPMWDTLSLLLLPALRGTSLFVLAVYSAEMDAPSFGDTHDEREREREGERASEQRK